jgi:hypothetical protein
LRKSIGHTEGVAASLLHHARLTQEGRAGIIAGGGAFRALGRGGGASGEKPLNRNWSRVGNPARQSISIIDHQS